MANDSRPGWWQKAPPDSPRGGNARGQPSETPDNHEVEEERYILCRQCRQAVTRPADRMAKNGTHRHIFANPAGVVYEIGCFRSVRDCGYAGKATPEFSWFPGFSWRLVFCGQCLTHLGWVFESPGSDAFHGLILSRLDETPPPKR